MRLKNVKGAREAVARDPRCLCGPGEKVMDWGKEFANDHPVELEIGMGKGRFILEKASMHPNINYVGVERYESVLIRALQKLDRFRDEGRALDNVRFVRMDAQDISAWFATGSVNRIYLNFSDPWPKKRHARRRLTSGEFLRRFEPILVPGGSLEFKTDNRDLFMFSLSELEGSSWRLLYKTEDLHADTEAMKDNVMTEYEEKFSARGNPVYKYIISCGNDRGTDT